MSTNAGKPLKVAIIGASGAYVHGGLLAVFSDPVGLLESSVWSVCSVVRKE